MLTLKTPIGRKNLEALSGTLLLLFLIEHLIGNSLLLLSDPGPYNWYTATLGSSWLTRILELALLIVFVTHISVGMVMRAHHRRIQLRNPNLPKPKKLSTRFIGYTGIIILIFLIIHLIRFFVPNRIMSTEGFDLFTEAHIAFSSLLYTMFYVISMIALASHLHHGIGSAMFSFKLIPRKQVPTIRTIGSWIGLVAPLLLGYIAVHLYIISD